MALKPTTKKKLIRGVEIGGGALVLFLLGLFGIRSCANRAQKAPESDVISKAQTYKDSTELMQAQTDYMKKQKEYALLEKQYAHDQIINEINHVKAVKDSIYSLGENYAEIWGKIRGGYDVPPITPSQPDYGWGFWQGDSVTGDTTTQKPAMEY